MKLSAYISDWNQSLTRYYSASEAKYLVMMLIEFYTQITQKQWIINPEIEISETEIEKINQAVQLLLIPSPIQYVLGEADFYGYKFFVNSSTLIPRPETEELVFHALKILNQQTTIQKVLDIGTGSGCIPISLGLEALKKQRKLQLSAIDISEEALKMATKNALHHQIEIEWIQHDILSEKKLDNQWDMIISNPPYIPEKEKTEIAPHVLDHEPHLALFVPDEKPLLFYEKIADFALQHLQPNGYLLFETHYLYGLEVGKMLTNKGFEEVVVLKDMPEYFRFAIGRKVNT